MRISKAMLFSTVCLSLIACSGGTENASAPSPTSAPQPVTAPAQTAPATLSAFDKGKKLYKRCSTCHTVEENGRHKVGPNLWAIYGMTAGTKDGFAYSKVMSASGIVWDEATMDAYIAKPNTFMPGNRMSFVGLKKQDDRDAVQAYLKAVTTPQ